MSLCNILKQNDPSVHLVFSTDDRFLPGTLVSIGSVLDFGCPHRFFDIHVLDTGLSKFSLSILRRLVDQYDNAKLAMHPVDLSLFKGANEMPVGGVATYARFLVGRVLPSRIERILYLDTDILAVRDVSKLYDVHLGQTIAAMGRDGYSENLSGDCPFATPEETACFPYFNAGVILLNLARWRREGLEETALDLISKHGTCLQFHDQTVLNYLLRGRITVLDNWWNCRDTHVEKDNAIYHYASGIKPWMAKHYREIDPLWWLYYDHRIAFLSPFKYRGWTQSNAKILLKRLAHPIPSSLLHTLACHSGTSSLVHKVAASLLKFRDIHDMRNHDRFRAIQSQILALPCRRKDNRT